MRSTVKQLTDLLRSWRRCRRGRARQVRTFRPLVQVLEDRWLPSSVTWTGGGGDMQWTTAANWSTGALPTAADDAIIPAVSGLTVKHAFGDHAIHSLSTDSPIDFQGGSLNLATASTDSTDFILEGGLVTGDGDLSIRGLLTWAGGTMGGTGATNAGGGMVIGVSTVFLDARTLNNGGNAIWTGTPDIVLFDQAVLNNLSGATFVINNHQSVFGAGDTTFNNAGILVRPAAVPGFTALNTTFNNNGRVEVHGGELDVNGGGTSSGGFLVDPGKTLAFQSGPVVLTAASSLNGPGNLVFNTGVQATLYGLYAATGKLTINGVVNFAVDANVAKMVLNGVMVGAGNVTVNSGLVWNGGVMAGLGSTTLASGSSSSITAPAAVTVFLQGRTLNNQGTLVWSGPVDVSMSGGSVFNNNAGATFNVKNDQNVFGGGSNRIVNAGTITKSAGSALTDIQVRLDNARTVTVNSGQMALDAGGVNTGKYTVAAGSSLTFGFGHQKVQAAGSVTGGGDVIVNNGTVSFSGTYSATGTLVLDNAVLKLASSITVPKMSFRSGLLDGAATLTIGTELDWTSGFMTGAGSTVISSGAVANIGSAVGGSVLVDGRTFDNGGTVNWTGPVDIGLVNGAVLNNQSAGVVNVQNDQTISMDGTSEIDNAGVFVKTAGVATTTVTGVLNNAGKVRAETGRLTLAFGGGGAGTYTVLSGAVLEFSGGNTVLAPGSNVTGAGDVVVSGGGVDCNGSYSNTGTLTLAAGTFVVNSNIPVKALNMIGGTLTGAGSLLVTNAFNWNSGAMSGAGQIILAPGSNSFLAGPGGTLPDFGRTLLNQGNLTWAGPTDIFLAAGSTLTNDSGANFLIKNDQTINADPGAVFNNAGTVKKTSGVAFTTIRAIFNNANAVVVSAGAVAFAGGGAHAGSFTVAGGSGLTFGGPKTVFKSASSVTGAGLVTFDSGTVTVAGTYSTTGPTVVNVATVSFANGGSTKVFNNGGTVLIPAGATLSVSGAYTQTGGTTFLNGGTLTATSVKITGGTLNGLGTINGNLVNAGLIEVGGLGATGKLSVNGKFVQTSTGIIDVELGGFIPATQFDVLAISGGATLDGTLNATIINGFAPPSGSTFDLLTFASHAGTFATTNLFGAFGTFSTLATSERLTIT